jgi:uncharacterized membrane protein YheB (UPF0754 family)
VGYWSLLLFPVIGALIGALTNQIAIRMLFRPYRPVRLFGVRVPFTPGVIPARRVAIAHSIAAAVEQNLIGGREIHELITGEHVRGLVETKVDGFFARLGPLAGALSGRFRPAIVTQVMEAIEEVASQALAPGGDLDIAERIEARINDMDLAKLEALIVDVTRRQLRYITLFGGVIGALIGTLQAVLSLWLPAVPPL